MEPGLKSEDFIDKTLSHVLRDLIIGTSFSNQSLQTQRLKMFLLGDKTRFRLKNFVNSLTVCHRARNLLVKATESVMSVFLLECFWAVCRTSTLSLAQNIRNILMLPTTKSSTKPSKLYQSRLYQVQDNLEAAFRGQAVPDSFV